MTARDVGSGGGGRPPDEVWFEHLFVRFHPAVRAYVARRAPAEPTTSSRRCSRWRGANLKPFLIILCRGCMRSRPGKPCMPYGVMSAVSDSINGS